MRSGAKLPLLRVLGSEINLAEMNDREFGPAPGEPQLRAADGTVLRTLEDLEHWLVAELDRRFPAPEEPDRRPHTSA